MNQVLPLLLIAGKRARGQGLRIWSTSPLSRPSPPARCNGPIEVSKVTPSGCQLIWKKPNDDEGSPLFKTFFLLEGNQLKMPFHNNDLCGMVQALQLEEHDHPTYIPVPLSSIHLGVRVVNFTAQVEVIIASGIIASGPKKLTSLLMRRLKHL